MLTHLSTKISKNKFKSIMDKYKNKIRLSPHAADKLSEGQRNIYKSESLMQILTQDTPTLVGRQNNGRYSAFYSRKDGYLRIIFSTNRNLRIITFYITRKLPKIK
ncbi:hypothetical protein ACFLZN_00980 [Nanoarchaeota archaeon]